MSTKQFFQEDEEHKIDGDPHFYEDDLSSDYFGTSSQGGKPQSIEEAPLFDECEQRFHEFLRSTPYIDQILQTSKEYRLVIESLNVLARFNDELKRILAIGRKGQLTPAKCDLINRKNRDLRVQIKSMLKDAGPQEAAATGGKAQNTKRELIKQRNYLMEENDKLLFEFKRCFLF